MIKSLFIALMLVTSSTSAFAVTENIKEGIDEAPVKIKLYYSITCPSCGEMIKTVIPKIRKEFVDTNKANIEYMPYPMETISLATETFLACMPNYESHKSALNDFLSNKNNWLYKSNTIVAMKEILNNYMTEEEFLACQTNEESYNKLTSKIQSYKDKKIIKRTPTLFINGKPTSSLLYKTIEEKINKELSK